MAGSVGNLNIKLMADPSPMGPGLAASQSSLVSWAADVARKSQLAGQALGQGMSDGANMAAAAMSSLATTAAAKPINLGGITDPAKMAAAGNALAKGLTQQMAGLQQLAKTSGIDLGTLIKADPAQLKALTARAGQDAVQGMIAAARSAAAAGQPMTAEMAKMLALSPGQANALGVQMGQEMARGAKQGQDAYKKVGAATGADTGKLAGASEGDLSKAAQQAANNMGEKALAANRSWRGRLASWFVGTAGWIAQQFGRLWQGIKSFDLGGAVTGLKNVLYSLGSSVEKAFTDPLGTARSLLNSIGDYATKTAGFVSSTITSLTSSVAGGITSVGKMLSSIDLGGVLGYLTKPLGAVAGVLGQTVGAIGQIAGAMVGIAGAAVSTLAGVLGAFVGVLQDVMKLAQQGGSRIKEMGLAALKAGVDVGQFQIAQMALKTDTEVTEKILFKFNVALANSGLSAEGTADAFSRLGLSGRELAKMPTAQALGMVAEKIRGIGDPALQAKAAFDVFGKSGMAALPALQQGAAGVKSAMDKIGKFGLGFTAQDVANVRAMDEATKQISFAKTGIINQLTLAVAPIAGTISGMIARFNTIDLSGLKETFFSVFSWIARVGAIALDLLNDTGMFRQAWGLAIDYLGAKFKQVIGATMQAIGASLKGTWIDKLSGGEAGLLMEGRGGLLTAEGNLQTAKLEKDAQKVWQEWQSKPWLSRLNEALEEARKKMNNVGAAPKKDPFAWLMPRLDELRKSLESPWDAFQGKAAEVFSLQAAGAFKIAPNLDFQSLGSEFQKLQEKYKVPEPKSPAAQLAGSKEAYSTIVKFQQGEQNETVQQTLKRIAQEQAERDKEQIRLGKEIADALKKNGPEVRDIP